MCGRYRLSRADQLPERFSLRKFQPAFAPRFNVAPTQQVAVVFDESPDTLSSAQWGPIPSWAKERKIGNSLINARAETVATKPAFRSAFKRRRCWILADGFYEWRRQEKGPKVPHDFSLRSGEPFALAGLWEEWREHEDGEPLRTCSIITTDANEVVAPVHHRMPVILPQATERRWLDRDARAEEVKTLLVPLESEQMKAVAVSSRVNSPHNEGPDLIIPAGRQARFAPASAERNSA